MLLAEVARTSRDVAATPARSAKTALIADCLRRCPPEEVPVAVAYLCGELPQRRTGVGWAALRSMPPAADEATLTLTAVDAAMTVIAATSGSGSTAGRRDLLRAVLAAATEPEQRLLAGLVAGELRQGALAAVVTDAVARAAGAVPADVRTAVMIRGSLAPVAAAVLADGPAALGAFRLEVGRGIQPMLAQTADGVAAALERTGPAAVEWKIDGIRVQAHRHGHDVAVFTRTLDEISARVPEVVEAVLALPVTSVVLDGEAVALRPDGRPRPFQETAGRTGSRVDVASARSATPLTPWFFDLLHVDGRDLLESPGHERTAALARLLPESARVPRLVTDDPVSAGAFLDEAIAAGHEGVVVKSLDAPYEAGRRGAAWVKVKPRHTLDLVVLAAEWGHGRRHGYLSNLHLGARDPETDGWVMLGKTFKGLTDAMLAWQTERLLALETSRSSYLVTVRPELLVEIAFDGVQTSSRYPGGMALRFARVLRYRDDKPASEADTVDAVRAVHLRP